MAILVATVATLSVGASWLFDRNARLLSEGPRTEALALGLLIGVLLVYRFPVHVRHNSKIQMSSVPIYLMASLLPAPLAAASAGGAIVLGELAVRSQKGNYWSDIACDAGRWMVIVLVGATVAHMQLFFSPLHVFPFIAAATVLWVGDVVTAPVTLCPMTREAPGTIMMAMMREAGMAEAAQYFLGFLGVLVAKEGDWALGLLFVPTALIYTASKRAKELHEGTRAMVEGMADTVDLRDPYTGGHSRRVTELTAAILQELGIVGQEVSLIVTAARAHDIGKIGIPDAVLKKEGPLTPEERAIMETHATWGADLLQRYPGFARGVDIVRHHHERWDGCGYPHKLKGTDIPFGARVLAVADSYDAMTSDRPYRRALTADKAASILLSGRGKQWDPAIVDACIRAIAGRLDQPASPLLSIVPETDGRVDSNLAAGTA
jgi:HD-GYP domain-containing protein (c-di-GMP phosphodiesterase class II)